MNLYHDVSVFFGETFAVLSNLSYLNPWKNITSILGPPESWFEHPDSEMNIIHPLLIRNYRTLENNVTALVALALPRVAPFRGIPSSLPQPAEPAYEDEAWFFVNGVATNESILAMNGRYLRRLFHRSFELIENPTDGVPVDLIECFFQRSLNSLTRPAEYTFERVHDAFINPRYRRVVLLGHSQGGIIISNVLQMLLDRYPGDERLTRLEIYTFASAADEMPFDLELTRRERRWVPYLEHFINLGDFIVKLGILQNRERIAGDVYIRDKEGHLLNAHYLPELEAKRYTGTRPGKRPRLYEYLAGRQPGDFPTFPKDLRTARAVEQEVMEEVSGEVKTVEP